LRITERVILFAISLILLGGILGCLPEPDTSVPVTVMPVTSTPALQPTSLSTSTPVLPPVQELEGPLLLVQTDVDAYHILDIASQTSIPFSLPSESREISLAKNLSPSKSHMLIATDTNDFLILTIHSGEVHFLPKSPIEPSQFNFEQAATQAQQALPELNYTELGIQAALHNTLTTSTGIVSWFDSDQHLITVDIGSESSTNLTLLDVETGERSRLESAPALVEAFWVSPDRQRILLKKGFLIEPGIWQDDQYYVIDMGEHTFIAVTLPEAVDNPSVFWFSNELIGIIHQLAPVGGNGFSLLNVNNMQSRSVLSEPFTAISTYQDHLITLQVDQETQTTNLAVRLQTGEVIDSITLESMCSLFTFVDADRFLLNCEEHSLLVDGDTLQSVPFKDPLLHYSRSPNRESILLTTRSQKTYLLDPTFTDEIQLSLMGEALQVLWLPDSSGFLYRSSDHIYLYYIAEQANHLLFTASFFRDYRNLNAVWIRN